MNIFTFSCGITSTLPIHTNSWKFWRYLHYISQKHTDFRSDFTDTRHSAPTFGYHSISIQSIRIFAKSKCCAINFIHADIVIKKLGCGSKTNWQNATACWVKCTQMPYFYFFIPSVLTQNMSYFNHHIRRCPPRWL